LGKILTVKNSLGESLPVFTLDAETYYENNPSGYSLRNKGLTTCMYIRDPRFYCHGFSYVDPEGKSGWITHYKLQAFFNELKKQRFAWLSHNCAFDGFLAYEHYGIEADYYLDTMSMSYGEWGVHESGSLKNLCKRLNLPGKLEGVLEETSGIRILSSEQETALIPYAIRDSEQTRSAFEILYYDRGFPEVELHIIDITIRAFTVPILEVNAGLCRAEIEEEDIRLKSLLESSLIKDAQLSSKCRQIVVDKGTTGLMRSRPCFAELIKSRGVVPPMKHAKTTKGELKYNDDGSPVYTYAFAKNDIELMNLGEDSRVSDLVAAWTGLKSTIRKTRAESFLIATDAGTKPLCVPLKYCGAHTMRWSGWDKINLQNLPSGRDGRGSRLREAITAPPGYVLVVADSSQIEARVNAWLWGQTDLLNLFANGDDPYAALASALYGVTVRKHSKHQDGINAHLRPVGKAMELGLGFGMGWKKYLDGCLSGSIIGEVVPMTPEGAIAAVDFYRAKRNKIIEGWDILKHALVMMAAKQTGFKVQNLLGICDDKIFMPNELYLHYKNLHFHTFKDKEFSELVYQTGFSRETGAIYTRIWHSKLDENICQCLARIIVAEQALEIAKKHRIVLLVHDEVVFLAKKEEADEALAFGITAMRKSPTWAPGIPLDAEGGHAYNYTK
jgi:DNA polymerase